MTSIHRSPSWTARSETRWRFTSPVPVEDLRGGTERGGMGHVEVSFQKERQILRKLEDHQLPFVEAPRIENSLR